MRTMAMQQIVRYMIEERISLLTAYVYYDAHYAEIVGDSLFSQPASTYLCDLALWGYSENRYSVISSAMLWI